MNSKIQVGLYKIKKIEALVLILFLITFSVANSSTLSIHSEYFTLSGKVLDENQKPIQGVSVKSNKSSKEATTDENGSFSITDVEINDELIFNSPKHYIKVIKIESRDEMTVTLKLKTQDEVVTATEIPAVFPGGIDGLINYLSKNLKYPKVARKKGIQGRVFASFVVGSDGNIRDIIILKGIGGGCDEETIRVIQSMPKWTPGKQDGRLVSSRFTLPLSFTLSR